MKTVKKNTKKEETKGRKKAPPAPTSFRIKAVIHPDERRGFWAEVPSLPGCRTEGDTLDEVFANLQEAIVGWLEASAIVNPPEEDEGAIVIEVRL